MTVRIDFGGGYLDVSDLVKYDTFTLTKNAFNNNYKASQSVCNFSMIFDPTIYSIWLSTTDIKVEIIEGSTVTFRGLVDKTRSKEYNGRLDNTIIDIEANDYLTLLDAKVGDIVYSDCKVLDPSDPANSIVHKLVAIATTDITISSDITISTVISRFSPGDEKQTVKNILDTLLYEYGYSLHLENGYELLPIKWSVESSTVIHTFNDSNCIGSISTKDSLDKYDATTVIYNILASANNVRLYTDNNCGYDSNGEFAGYTIPNTFYYPPEANVIDDTTGTNQLVYQDYTDEGITYRTNKAIVQNLDYNYKNFDSDFKAIVTTENHFVDRSMDAGITVTAAEFFAKKCRLLYRNNTGSAKQIYYNNVYGTVWYRSADCSSTVGDKDSDKLYTYTSQYIFDKTTADTFVKALHAQHTAGNTIYKITSDDLLPEGALVLVDTNDGTNRTCQISSVTYNEKTNLYTYNCVSCKSTRLGLTSQTYNFRGNATVVKPFSISPSTKTINVPYVDGAPVYTNAYVSLAVIQEGINVTSGWTLTATPTGVTGHFEGSSYFIDTAPATGGSVAITASKTGFDTISTIVQVEGTDGGSTWQPLAPLVDVVAEKEGLRVYLTDRYLSGVQGVNTYTATWYLADVEQATMVFGDLDTILLPFSGSAFYEASDIDTMSVKVYVVNTSGLGATTWVNEGAIDTDDYGTWTITAPLLSSYTSRRDFSVSAEQGSLSRAQYGDVVYRVEIKRYDDVDYYKPNLTADPYASEDNYKDGTGYVTVTNYIQQRVPLETQDTNPQSTSYTYRFTAVNATTGVVGGSTTVTLIASASTAQDIVNHSMDAEKFNVQDLAAVSSVFGSIRSDGIAKDSTNFWNLSDPASALGYGEEGEMCVGTSASVEPYDPVNKPSGYRDGDSFFHFIPRTVGGVLKGLYMKLANFIITAINSTVTGTFIVLSRFTGKQLLRVSEEENKVYGLQRQTTYEDIENVTRVSGIEEYDTLDITEGGGVIYGVTGEDEKLLAYNTATDTEVAIDCEAGDNFSVCQLVGDEVVCVGGSTVKGYNLTDSAWVKYTSITYAPITISTIAKYRWIAQIYNGKLYCPSDNSTTMDIIDLSDNSYTSVTISTTNKQRYTSQIYNGKLYCPNNGSTMDIIDLSDNSYTSVTISTTNKTRYTSQIYNGKLYCPNNGSTMDIIDLSDNSYTSVNISTTNKNRYTSQIYNGKLYCPNDDSTTMDIIDLSDNSYASVNISTTDKYRYTSQIYNGKLCCPNYNSTTMDIIDLSDNNYTSVTISTTNKSRPTSQIYNGNLCCPNYNSTTMDIIDLSDNNYTSVTISTTDKQRRTSHIYNGKLYCPNNDSTTMDIIDLSLTLADTHKTTKVYNNAHMYIVSANMVEKVDVLNETHTQLTLTSMPTPLASCSNSTDVYVVDLASGRIAKINVTNAVTYTATTAKTGYLNYYCSGTTMYFTGRGAKVLKLNVTTGSQTEINLTTVLDNDLTYKVFYLSNYIYIFSQTSAVYFARVPTANFQLSAVEQYFLYNDIGNIRSRFWMGATTVYLAESRSGYMNKFTGVLFDQQVTRDVQKEIGSGFVEREVNANGVTTLATADGDKIIFDAEKNLMASRATKLATPRKINNVPFDGTADIITQEAPPTPWAQYSGKDIPQLPDNLAGTTYKRDNDWVSTDGWIGWGSLNTLSIENNMLKVVSTVSGAGIERTIGLYANKTVVIAIESQDDIGDVKFFNGAVYVTVPFYKITNKKVIAYFYSATTHTTFLFRVYNTAHTPNTIYVSSIYIGTGAYDRIVFDNSYHYRHLLNNAVVPTPQGLYFNGETSYLRSKEKITLPDVFTFSATINCAIKSADQAFLAQNTYGQPTARILIYRPPNSNELHVIGTDGTTASIFFNMAGYFAGLDNTDIDLKVEIDFVSKTIKAYRNGIQFGSTVSAPTIIKPSSNNIYFGNDALGSNRLLGYMRNIQLYDTALTDTQRNWLAQGNTPPILYDVTNYETEQGVAPITEGVETIRRDEDFTMNTYLDGKKLRIANTDDAQITCTLPSGQTMNGQTSFTIAPDTLLEFELIGTAWKCISKEWEILWENPAKASSFVSQLVTLSAVKEQFKRLVFTYGAFSGGAGYTNVHTKEIQTSTTYTDLFYVTIGEGVLPQPAGQRSRSAINITGNTLTFGEGFTTIIDNSAIIPHAIYGIK